MTTVTIERIAAGGDGVGRLEDGMAVFVPRSAPGDVAHVEIVERRRRYARARPVGIVSPGPGRAAPACKHYVRDRCGGCQLQHLTIEAQRALKRAIVGDALRRIGHRDVADPDIVASPQPWRYRTKITLRAAGGHVGFHPYDQPEHVFDLEECPITRERLMALWRRVDRQRDLLPPRLTAVVLREDRAGGLHVIVGDARGTPWDAGPVARAVGEAGVCYWWAPVRGAGRVVWGPAPTFPALAFEQVNPELADRIRHDAVAALGTAAGSVVWDLYGGVGDTARRLADLGAEVWSVDADRTALDWAKARESGKPGAGVAGGGSVRYVVGRVEQSLHRLPEPHAVVANPPRTGLDRRVAARLERWGAARRGGRLAYISCDSATLARDLARMPSLALQGVTAYDLFPHTAHVESLAVLEAA